MIYGRVASVSKLLLNSLTEKTWLELTRAAREIPDDAVYSISHHYLINNEDDTYFVPAPEESATHLKYHFHWEK